MAAIDIPALVRTLDLAGEAPCPLPDWLAESTSNPRPFWTALFEHAHGLAPLRSRPGEPQDLYQDAVLRQTRMGRLAFVSYDRGIAHSLSFDTLDARASALAAAWERGGAVAGATIALVFPLGMQLLIALAASLRLGLCISILEPCGARTLRARLESLAPAHVVGEPDTVDQLGSFAALALPFVDSGPPSSTVPFAYAPGQPLAKLFSPLRSPLSQPTVLSAARALEDGLRDSIFALRIGAGDVLAAPGFHTQQHFPALLLATWLAGATFVHLSLGEVRKRPSLLVEASVSTLGLSADLFEILRSTPVSLRHMRHVFHPVDEPLDWTVAHDLLRRLDLLSVMSSNVLIDAASGGCLLISARRPGSVSARVFPAPGRSFKLLDLSGRGEVSAGGVGIFGIPVAPKGFDGYFIVADRSGEHLYGSTIAPRRGARLFPTYELEEWGATLPGVTAAAVVPVPESGPCGRWSFHCLFFVSHRLPVGALTKEQVKHAILSDLGDDFLPDEIIFVPLRPRLIRGTVDAEWCHRQYLSGMLSRKARLPIFRHLSALRSLVEG